MAALRHWDTAKKASLFERIQSDRHSVGSQSLISSIKLNLGRILNARPGECHATQGLGIVDTNDAILSSAELQVSICQSIKHCIQQFEPRISSVDVMLSSQFGQAALCFTVIAYIQLGSGDQKIELDIQLNDSKFRIS